MIAYVNKNDRRNSSKFYRGECLGWPHTSYGADYIIYSFSVRLSECLVSFKFLGMSCMGSFQ